jgi:hypothetical protein
MCGPFDRAPRFDAAASLPDAGPTVSGGDANGGGARADLGGDDGALGIRVAAPAGAIS